MDYKALIKATRDYATEDRARSWRLVLTTLAIAIALIVGIALAPSVWIKVPIAILLGLVAMRIFIFYHDYEHGAILRGSKLGKALMSTIGVLELAAPSVWKSTHDYHHQHNSQLTPHSIGSFPVVTVDDYAAMSKRERFAYRAERHPLVFIFGYFTVFMVGFSTLPIFRDLKRHWWAPVALLIHLALIAAVWVGFGHFTAQPGWSNVLALVVIPFFIASGAGSYLFYVQHSFPDAEFRVGDAWEYGHAALKTSSMFDMNPVLHWFTGNIGYHHIHHLNHRIPFYKLPEVYKAFPELQSPGRTSWRWRDIRAAVACAVWDPDSHKMITYRELKERLRQRATAAA